MERNEFLKLGFNGILGVSTLAACTKTTANTTNARDNVFSDGVSLELATVAGSISAGYKLTHAIVVSA